jgi:hypothetical protein
MTHLKKFANENFRDEVRGVLTADMLYRREKKWPLRNINTAMESLPSLMDEDFCGLQTILRKYQGKLTLCGGLVTRILFPDVLDRSMDADLFFHNVTKEQAEQILEECVISLISLKREPFQKIRLERRKYVTNVVVDDSNKSTVRIFQFIHRIYPSLDLVLGGFDIPYGMLAFNGDNVVGTPIAEWCLKNRCHIVDTTRRSLSYENRIMKYVRRFDMDVFFPGLTYDWIAKILPASEIRAIADVITTLLKSKGLAITDSDNHFIPDKELARRLESVESLNSKHCGRLRVTYEVATVYQNQKVIGNEGDVRNLKCYSDYSSCEVEGEVIPYANSTMIKCGNFEGVIVYHEFEEGENISYQRAADIYRDLVEHPSVKSVQCSSLGYYYRHTRQRVGSLGVFWNKYRNAGLTKKSDRIDILKVVNQYISEETRRLDQWLKRNEWITENPGRQWTSSFNPIMEDPREFYKENYVPFYVGIPSNIENTLRLGLRDNQSVLYKLPRDVFKMLLKYIVRNYM